MIEHRGAQVEDQALSDPRGDPALGQGDRRRAHRQQHREGRRPHHHILASLANPHVDDHAVEERRRRTDRGVHGQQPQEHRQVNPVGDRELQDAPDSAGRRACPLTEASCMNERMVRPGPTPRAIDISIEA